MAASVSTMRPLRRAQAVLHQERALAHLPQGDAPAQLREQIRLGGGQRQQLRRGLELARRLRVDHPGLGIRQQPLGQRHLLGVRRADRAQVRHPVQDGHVGDAEGAGQLPRRLQPARHAQVREDRPRLVDHEEEATTPRRRRRRCRRPCGRAPPATRRWRTPSGRPARPTSRARRGRARRAGPTGRGRASSDRRTCRRGRRGRGGAARARRPARPRGGRVARCAASGRRRRSGVSSASTTTGTVGTAVARVASASAAPKRGALAGHQAPARDRRWPGRRATPSAGARWRRAGRRSPPSPSGPGSSGLSRMAPPGPERHRADAPGVGQVAVLALGVDHPGPAPEHRLTPEEGLDERALAPADLAEDDHVRDWTPRRRRRARRGRRRRSRPAGRRR